MKFQWCDLKFQWRERKNFKRICLFRVNWQPQGSGWLREFSFGLVRPWRFALKREYGHTIICGLGLRLHFKKASGGAFA